MSEQKHAPADEKAATVTEEAMAPEAEAKEAASTFLMDASREERILREFSEVDQKVQTVYFEKAAKQVQDYARHVVLEGMELVTKLHKETKRKTANLNVSVGFAACVRLFGV